jgi:hypothetical protein
VLAVMTSLRKSKVLEAMVLLRKGKEQTSIIIVQNIVYLIMKKQIQILNKNILVY